MRVETQVVHGSAAEALVDRSGQADLLVVGAQRSRIPVGLSLGLVNHAVLHHATCPVTVVPEIATG